MEQFAREYQQQEQAIEQMTTDLTSAQLAIREARQETEKVKAMYAATQPSEQDQMVRESEKETIAILRAEIKEAVQRREEMEQHLDALQTELSNTRRELDEKMSDTTTVQQSQVR